MEKNKIKAPFVFLTKAQNPDNHCESPHPVNIVDFHFSL